MYTLAPHSACIRDCIHPSSPSFAFVYFVFLAFSFSCCSFFAVGSLDMSCRIFSLLHVEGFHHVTLAAHRGAIVACFFEHQSLNVSSPQLRNLKCLFDGSLSLIFSNQGLVGTKFSLRYFAQVVVLVYASSGSHAAVNSDAVVG